MIQKVSHYISLGKISTRLTFRKNLKQFFKYLMFNLAAMLGKLFFFSFPLFAFAEHDMIKQIKQSKHIVIEEAFDDASSQKTYETAKHFSLLYQIFSLAGLLLIGGLSYGLVVLGTGIDDYYDLNRYYFQFISMAISGTMLITFIFLKSIYMESLIYLIATEKEMTLSEILRKSNEMMSHKVQLFYIKSYYIIFGILYLLVAGSTFYLTYVYFIYFWFVLITILLIVLGLVLLSILMLNYKVASSSLFDDALKGHAFKEVVEQEEVEEPNQQLKSEILMTLFNVAIESDKHQVDTTTLDEEDETDEEEIDMEEEIGDSDDKKLDDQDDDLDEQDTDLEDHDEDQEDK